MIKKVFFPLLKNKFSLTFIVFIVWIAFFDANSLINRTANLRHVHRLENEIIFFREKIKDDNARLEELYSDPSNLEKFAREQYFMKMENEDVFIIE